MTIIDSRDAWPFPAITDAHKAESTAWVEMSEAHMWDLLGAVPPIYIPGGFMVGEEADWSPERGAIFTAIISSNDRHYGRNLGRQEAKYAKALLLAELS